METKLKLAELVKLDAYVELSDNLKVRTKKNVKQSSSGQSR